MSLSLLSATAFMVTSTPSPMTRTIQGFVDAHKIPGAVVLVADRDRLLEVAVAGMADIENRRPMRPDTLFWVASMAKPITAAALMMLVDEGKVDLDAPASKYLPEFSKVSFTVRDTLRHTSGLPLFSPLEERRESGIIPILPLWLAVRGYAMTPLEFAPGSKWQYSNAGYNVAGRIIETTSGMSFGRFIKTRLFDPLGMRDTTFSPSRSQLSRLAKSYRPDSKGKGFVEDRILPFEHPMTAQTREPFPAGGLFSTAKDLMRFCQMMLGKGQVRGKRLLSEAAVREATANQVAIPNSVRYGFGWFTTPEGNYLKTGAHGTVMINYPTLNRTVIILIEHSTLQQGNSWDLYNPITEAAFKVGK